MLNNMTKIFILTLISLAFLGASNSYALTLPNIEIPNFDDIQVTVAATPTTTPTLKITIKPIKKIGFRIALKKTNAIKEIERRITSLEKLVEKINLIKRVSETQRSTLLAQIQIESQKLQELKEKIEAETDAAALIEQKKSITESYRIYALFIPKIEIMAHADKIISIAEALEPKTNDEALLTKIADSKTKAETALNLVTPLVPEQYPDFKVTLKSARDLLRVARTQLNEVFADIKSVNE